LRVRPPNKPKQYVAACIVVKSVVYMYVLAAEADGTGAQFGLTMWD